MTTKQLESIRQHGLNLLAIYPEATEKDPVALCKKLRKLEAKAHRLTEELCGSITNARAAAADVELDWILARVEPLLGNGPAVMLNRDPRGYALKIDDATTRELMDAGKPIHRDWGGYGILAPEIGPQGE